MFVEPTRIHGRALTCEVYILLRQGAFSFAINLGAVSLGTEGTWIFCKVCGGTITVKIDGLAYTCIPEDWEREVSGNVDYGFSEIVKDWQGLRMPDRDILYVQHLLERWSRATMIQEWRYADA